MKEKIDSASPIKSGTISIFPSSSELEEEEDNTLPSVEPHSQPESSEEDNSMEYGAYSEVDDAQKAAGHFLLTLKERYRLSQAAIDFAVGSVKQMIGFICNILKTSVEQILQDSGIDIPDLPEVFDNVNPFDGLETEHQQTQF